MYEFIYKQKSTKKNSRIIFVDIHSATIVVKCRLALFFEFQVGPVETFQFEIVG